MRRIDLSSREAYLNWVEDWKHEYNLISRKIRNLKNEKNYVRDHLRDLSRLVGGLPDFLEISRCRCMNTYINEKHTLRCQARHLLYLRLAGKLASREAKMAALYDEALIEDAAREHTDDVVNV